jgi:hypothetical protein
MYCPYGINTFCISGYLTAAVKLTVHVEISQTNCPFETNIDRTGVKNLIDCMEPCIWPSLPNVSLMTAAVNSQFELTET